MAKKRDTADYITWREDISAALSEARAAHWLLRALAWGPLSGGWRGQGETRQWLEGWAIDGLGRALDTAEGAHRKLIRAVVAARRDSDESDAWLRRQLEGLDRGGES